MNAMQPAGGDASLDHGRTEPERQELPTSHHAVLPFSQHSQPSIGLPIEGVSVTP
jgi:hypothetical protein